MALVANVARDSFGNVIPEAQVSVFTAGTETLASIFSDNNNTLSKPNPFDADDQGQYSFFADPGEVKIRVEKQGFETFELDFVPVAVTSFSELQEGAGISYSGPNINVLAATPTAIPFDTLVFDDASLVSLPNIQIQEQGMYHVAGSLILDNTLTTATHCDLSVQGGGVTLDTGFGTNLTIRVSAIYRAAALDNITLTITPQGGAAEILAGTPNLSVALLYAF